MVELPERNVFWKTLNTRFAQDERYQVQALFLPDRKKKYSAVVVGDSLFQQSIPDSILDQPNTPRVIINGYDADDLRLVSRALVPGDRRTKSEVCALVVQVSPLFSLRAKALGANSDPELLRKVLRRRELATSITLFFEIIQKWAKTERSLPDLQSDPARPPRMVGQAKFSDPNGENWGRAFDGFERYKGKIIAVFDTRGTDWGDNGNLIESTLNRLEAMAAGDERFTWTTLEGLGSASVPGCDTK